jgi:hypothetical protein
MKRIYHHYNKWEDYKSGFYNNTSAKEKEKYISKVFDLFNNEELTNKYMSKVINEWKCSCEHNLTNLSMNRVAYIGQAACCIYANVPNLITMYAWKFLSDDVRTRSDKIALKKILIWEQNQKLKNTLTTGSKKATITEYQMKLQLNWKKED